MSCIIDNPLTGENMEQDCVAGLYQSLGMSVGEEFSTKDVSLLYDKVCHVPSNSREVHAAMTKIAGGDSSWSCVGENVLDVLIEMEREREQQEMLYWDRQLLNVGNLYQMMDYQQQSTGSTSIKKVHNSDPAHIQPCTTEMDSVNDVQMGKPERNTELYGRVKRLKKAARHCWARLASEGVCSMLPSPWQGQRLRIRGQAWGCLSLSDILQLVEVKYDVVTHLLYTEMLQEHQTESVWDTLLPWQQHREVEALEDLAEEALESFEMLRMAELPGAFRMYNAYLGASFRGCRSWSAVSLLTELHTFRQQERDMLTVLGERLHGDSLRLLCLYIRLATVRAQREKMSYSALLAARQSWETWPPVNSPCRPEQVTLWLHYGGEEEEEEEALQQQAVLQLLVLTQKLERKLLVRLVHMVSLEDLQMPGCTAPPKEDGHTQPALRSACIKRLRQIYAQLQTHNVTQTLSDQANPPPQHELQTKGEWSEVQLEDCARLLLIHLTELQEAQASALLQALVDRNEQRVQALRDQYQSETEAQSFSNLHRLLISEVSLKASSSNDQTRAHQIGGGSPEAQTADSGKMSSGELNEVQTADGTNRQDVCSGCGAVMEDLPYLEILSASDAKGKTHEGLHAEGGGQEEDEEGAMKSPQSYEKQGSLIPLAWSKPPEEETDYEAEASHGDASQSQDVESGLSQVLSTHGEETVWERDREELKPTHSDAAGHQSAEQQCSTVEQLHLNTRPSDDQPDEGETASEHDVQTHKPHLLADSSGTSSHAADGLSSGASNDAANAGREVTEVEMSPDGTESEVWDLRGPEPSHNEDRKYSPEASADCSLSERKALREHTPVSAVERERTMRNLVDMQKKVEQRQQRDRERQLLRVQERLSIIQNRKAEEDLLGLKHTDRLRHLTQDLPLEDKNQQKTVVKERLEQLRRERSYVMQSKRDRNTAGFKELLGPVTLHSRGREEEHCDTAV